jgi:molybdopterin molybdotransferase
MERVSVETFRQTALSLAEPVADVEDVALGEAVGRVAAGPVRAAVPLPPFVRSAVDGYALRAGERTAALRVVGKVTAGHPAERPLPPGAAYEITTGAPVPDGADAVALVEESRRDGDWVVIDEPVVPGSHISPVGEDFQLQQELVSGGRRLSSVTVAALASQGLVTVPVYRRPRVAILSTGDELTPLGEPLTFGRVYDVNGAALEALVRAAGAEPLRLGVLPDRYEAVRAGLQSAAARTDWDLLVTSGGTGASVPLFQGQDVTALHDLIPYVLGELGTLRHHGIRMVPGRPTALGQLGGRPVVALPGWPYAVLIHFELVVAPVIRRLGHLPARRRPTRQAVLDEALDVAPGFTRVLQVTLRAEADGLYRATPLLPPPPPSASRMMTQMLAADGYIILSDDTGQGRVVPAGTTLTVWLDPFVAAARGIELDG